MFDIGFTEMLLIGVVALIVIGPQRLPKVARTAGHLYGRLQRYVSTVRTDISREIQLDEIRRAGQSFKESVESVATNVEQQATIVDDYLRNETSNVSKVVAAMGTTEGERLVTEQALTEGVGGQQQSLPLDEPGAEPAPTASTIIETARKDGGGNAA